MSRGRRRENGPELGARVQAPSRPLTSAEDAPSTRMRRGCAGSMSSIDSPGASVYCSWAGIGLASAARPGGAWRGSAKCWVSWVTSPSLIFMMLSEYVGMPS